MRNIPKSASHGLLLLSGLTLWGCPATEPPHAATPSSAPFVAPVGGAATVKGGDTTMHLTIGGPGAPGRIRGPGRELRFHGPDDR